jgi:hypothetical protein
MSTDGMEGLILRENEVLEVLMMFKKSKTKKRMFALTSKRKCSTKRVEFRNSRDVPQFYPEAPKGYAIF